MYRERQCEPCDAWRCCRLYHRIQDCWNRPIVGPPTASNMAVVKRTSADNNCTMR
jgi:hypothetical protein